MGNLIRLRENKIPLTGVLNLLRQDFKVCTRFEILPWQFGKLAFFPYFLCVVAWKRKQEWRIFLQGAPLFMIKKVKATS